MCTVTFISANDHYYITSNRDEKKLRKAGIPPQKYLINNVELLFPKDADAGGSWIGMNAYGHMAVLLNGAFEKHLPAPFYERSRGLIFIEIIASLTPVSHFHQIDLTHIEPFTIIIYSDERLTECRWDGNDKFVLALNINQSYIWSSVTLYDKETILKRENWFLNWFSSNPHPTSEAIFRFHCFGGDGDKENDFCMVRKNDFLTVSITSMERSSQTGKMLYCDLNSNQKQETDFFFSPSLQEK